MIRQAFGAVIEREFKRFFRQRGRLLSTFARPVLWLAVVGSGFASVIPAPGGVTYQQYMLPGIFGMVLLFNGMMNALSTVHDREFGPMRMLLIAPLPRSAVVAAKTLSSVLLGLAQALVLLPLVPLLGLRPVGSELALFLGATVVTAFSLSALGMLIASSVRSVENFAVVMNFVIFPMFFLSGALYPATRLPGFLQPLVLLNPLTYGVDLMRHSLLPPSGSGIPAGEFSPALSLVLLLGFSGAALILASVFFDREEHLGGILLIGRPRPGRAAASDHASSRNRR